MYRKNTIVAVSAKHVHICTELFSCTFTSQLVFMPLHTRSTGDEVTTHARNLTLRRGLMRAGTDGDPRRDF